MRMISARKSNLLCFFPSIAKTNAADTPINDVVAAIIATESNRNFGVPSGHHSRERKKGCIKCISRQIRELRKGEAKAVFLWPSRWYHNFFVSSAQRFQQQTLFDHLVIFRGDDGTLHLLSPCGSELKNSDAFDSLKSSGIAAGMGLCSFRGFQGFCKEGCVYTEVRCERTPEESAFGKVFKGDNLYLIQRPRHSRNALFRRSLLISSPSHRSQETCTLRGCLVDMPFVAIPRAICLNFSDLSPVNFSVSKLRCGDLKQLLVQSRWCAVLAALSKDFRLLIGIFLQMSIAVCAINGHPFANIAELALSDSQPPYSVKEGNYNTRRSQTNRSGHSSDRKCSLIDIIRRKCDKHHQPNGTMCNSPLERIHKGRKRKQRFVHTDIKLENFLFDFTNDDIPTANGDATYERSPVCTDRSNVTTISSPFHIGGDTDKQSVSDNMAAALHTPMSTSPISSGVICHDASSNLHKLHNATVSSCCTALPTASGPGSPWPSAQPIGFLVHTLQELLLCSWLKVELIDFEGVVPHGHPYIGNSTEGYLSPQQILAAAMMGKQQQSPKKSRSVAPCAVVACVADDAWALGECFSRILRACFGDHPCLVRKKLGLTAAPHIDAVGGKYGCDDVVQMSPCTTTSRTFKMSPTAQTVRRLGVDNSTSSYWRSSSAASTINNSSCTLHKLDDTAALGHSRASTAAGATASSTTTTPAAKPINRKCCSPKDVYSRRCVEEFVPLLEGLQCVDAKCRWSAGRAANWLLSKWCNTPAVVHHSSVV